MADSYISNFINSLLSQECKGLAKVLFTTEKNCNDFYIGFLYRNSYAIDDLLDYREARLRTADMSLDTFIGMCDNIGMREAFERVFLQPVSPSEMELIEKAIIDGRTSLEAIYERFMMNVNENVLKHVL